MFKCGPYQFELQISESTHVVSKHTGNQLRHIVGHLRLNGLEPKEFLDIAKEQGIFSNDGHETDTSWGVTNSSYRYESGGNPTVYQLTLELDEQETYSVQELILGDLTLKPYLYSQEIIDDELFISALVEIPKETVPQLINLMQPDKYFDVVRRGISEEPIHMRFGKCIWSDHETTVKYHLYLVPESYDLTGKHAHQLLLGEPEGSNSRRSIAKANLRHQELVSLLLQKGILDEVDVEAIEKKVEEKFVAEYRHLWKVKNVDDWNLE